MTATSSGERTHPNLILAVLALEGGIIGEKLFVALVIMAVVTSLISAPVRP